MNKQTKQVHHSRSVAVVTPARNEAAHLASTIRAMVHQTHRPSVWVIVDDGSTDGTRKIAEKASAAHPWIRVVSRRDRGRRKLGGGVIEAFDDGLASIDEPYKFIAKMDADVTFGSRYVERALEYFDSDPRLGALSGKVYRRENRNLVEEFMIDEMVAGQWKLYRRTCFEAIGGFRREIMWDGIDFHEARRAGWRTRSIGDAELRIVHHRLMGSSDRNVFVGRLRWGRGQWFLGSHPLYVLAASVFRMKERPRVIGGAFIAIGYALSALRRRNRYGTRSFRKDLHHWQIKRLIGLASGRLR